MCGEGTRAEEDWNREKVESVGTGRVPQRKPTSLGFAISIFPTHGSSPEPSMASAAPQSPGTRVYSLVPDYRHGYWRRSEL